MFEVHNSLVQHSVLCLAGVSKNCLDQFKLIFYICYLCVKILQCNLNVHVHWLLQF